MGNNSNILTGAEKCWIVSTDQIHSDSEIADSINSVIELILS